MFGTVTAYVFKKLLTHLLNDYSYAYADVISAFGLLEIKIVQHSFKPCCCSNFNYAI